jgi:putative ABC transport system permease protein
MGLLAKLGLGMVMIVIVTIPVTALFMMPDWLLLACVMLLASWMALTRVGQQAWSAARVGIATIPKRFSASAVVVVGIAGVVGVLVALLAMGSGFEKTLKQTGTDDTAIIMQAGAQSESSSAISHDTAAVASQASQISKNAEGKPIISPELVVTASLRKKSTGHDANVVIRGVGEWAWEVRPQIKVIAGRKFKAGLHELLIGNGVHQQFVGTDIGSTLMINNQSWTVVGIFDSGDAYNSEMWSDTETVASAFRRGSGKTSLVVRLTDASAFDAFKAALASDPRLKVDVYTTRQYYNRQSEELTKLARILGMTIGGIMAVGAIFGALNTMYSAVATRAREIATLRAIGFQSLPVIVSVLLETLLLAAAGGAIGAAIAWAVFDGFTAATLGASGQIMFAFNVSQALLWNGLKWALAIGLIGGLFPAVRAARMPITVGLREL